MVGGYVPDAAHVRGELVHVVHAFGRLEAALEVAQVGHHELVRGALLELGLLHVHRPHPMPLGLQTLDEMMGDEAPRSRDYYLHMVFSSGILRPAHHL